MTTLRDRLEALYRDVDVEARLRADPVAFPRRYAVPRDAEIAGLVAAGLAYGRVSLFRPVLEEIFRQADARGGPRRYVERFDPERDGRDLRPLVYRWNRGIDLVLLFAALRRAVERWGGLEPVFAGDEARTSLEGGIGTLRSLAVDEARRCGVEADDFAGLPRGFRTMLPSPADGSACKRMNMFLRWMVRPPREQIDLGIWTILSPDRLVVPLDVHVARIARFVGLTDRTDGSWRTAVEVTEGLRALDPVDPLRFDFAIAHLGISGQCKGRWDTRICPDCPLQDVCRVATNKDTEGTGKTRSTRRRTTAMP